jgi:pyoverdine/dityrosine biosynthesis protein Dit1
VNNKLDTYHTVIKDIIKDIDNDGFLEVGGLEVNDAYCLQCDSAYYNPYQIYKLSEKVEFDQSNSELLTKQLYGVYLGQKRLDSVVQILK